MSSHVGEVFFTISAKLPLHIIGSRPCIVRDHLRKLNQILPAEVASASSNGNKRIWRHRIRPTRWERA